MARISATKLDDIKEAAKKRIHGHLHTGGVLQASDQELIEIYAETYAFYCKMKAELRGKALLMKYTNKAGATNLIKNPLAIELTKTVQVLNNLLRSLGLTPAQRKEFADDGFIPKDGEKDEQPDRDEFESY